MIKTNWLLLALISFLLQGCCIWGYQETTETNWVNTIDPNETAHAIQICKLEEKNKQALRTEEFIQLVRQECRKKSPFASVDFIDGLTNKPMDLASKYEQALCPSILKNDSLTYSQVSGYCRSCYLSFWDEEQCYKASGLQLVKQTSYTCKSMRLF